MNIPTWQKNMVNLNGQDFWFVHVPKTGGASIKKYASTHGISMYSRGHEEFSDDIRHRLDPVLIMVVLRCPVEQTRSLYSYLKIEREKPSFMNRTGFPGMQSFSDWLRNPSLGFWGDKWEKRWFPNFYTNFFGKENGIASYDIAVERLKSFDFVFDTKSLTVDFNKKFVRRYNLPKFTININQSKRFEIRKEDIEFIKKQREQDFEICKVFGISTI